jgi:hypothetical protein
VIEVEPAQVVLVGLPLAAVLTDDESGNRFQHLAGPHQRPRFDLSGRDDTLARGVGRADEPLAGRIDFGEIPEGSRPCDGDVGRQQQRQHHVNRTSLVDDDLDAGPPHRAEVGERDNDVVRPGLKRIQRVAAEAVRQRRYHTTAGSRLGFDRGTGQPPTRLVGDDAANGWNVAKRRCRKEHGNGQRNGKAKHAHHPARDDEPACRVDCALRGAQNREQ